MNNINSPPAPPDASGPDQTALKEEPEFFRGMVGTVYRVRDGKLESLSRSIVAEVYRGSLRCLLPKQ
jgi:hypothetical protein